MKNLQAVSAASSAVEVETHLKGLRDRAKAGVQIRVIGKAKPGFDVRKLGNLRLHSRTIIRDGEQAFIGSQSLRAAELDSRREVGLIVHDSQIVKKIMETFESDWASGVGLKSLTAIAENVAAPQQTEKAIEVSVEELYPITMTVKRAVKRVVAQAGEAVLNDGGVQDTVKKYLKKAVSKPSMKPSEN